MMPSRRRRASNARHAVIAVLLVFFVGSCAADALSDGSDAASSSDAGADSSGSLDSSEIASDARKGDGTLYPGDVCFVPDDGACRSPITGCPSRAECTAFGYFCACRPCSFVFDDGACSWTMDDGKITLGTMVVFVPEVDGGTRVLPVRGGLPDCTPTGGYLVEVLPGKITVTLCPASCDEHRADPALPFTINRGGCPIDTR